MPTGYTAEVCDGKVTEFKDFAMICARAFGALITMRDDPMNADIPQEFKPSTYSLLQLQDAQARLVEYQHMTAHQADSAAQAAYEKALESHQRYEAEAQATDDRLDAMISKVEAWTPPTAEHVQMKAFMLEQLRISKRGSYRDTPPEKLTGAAWLEAETKRAMKDVEYHAGENAKEIERAKGRTEWVKSLRASL